MIAAASADVFRSMCLMLAVVVTSRQWRFQDELPDGCDSLMVCDGWKRSVAGPNAYAGRISCASRQEKGAVPVGQSLPAHINMCQII